MNEHTLHTVRTANQVPKPEHLRLKHKRVAVCSMRTETAVFLPIMHSLSLFLNCLDVVCKCVAVLASIVCPKMSEYIFSLPVLRNRDSLSLSPSQSDASMLSPFVHGTWGLTDKSQTTKHPDHIPIHLYSPGLDIVRSINLRFDTIIFNISFGRALLYAIQIYGPSEVHSSCVEK